MTENTTASGAADLPEALKLASILRGLDTRHYFGNKKLVAAADELERLHALAASAPVAPTQPATPKGFVLVPVEATEDMKAAAVKYANGTAVYKNVAAAALRIEEGIYGEVYEAMIAAAPKADHIPEAGQKVALLQQGEYLPLPSQPYCHHYHINGGDEGTCYYTADQMHAYVDADRAARGAAQAAPAEIDAKSFQSYAETRAYSKGYYAGKKAALAAPAVTAQGQYYDAHFASSGHRPHFLPFSARTAIASRHGTHVTKEFNALVADVVSEFMARHLATPAAPAPVAGYVLRLEGTDMDAERRKMQHYDDPFVMPLDGTQAAQPEGGANGPQ